jgi:hypothetical protein
MNVTVRDLTAVLALAAGTRNAQAPLSVAMAAMAIRCFRKFLC